MMVSDPAFAPTSPPDTGASRHPMPRSPRRAANCLLASGEMELISTTTEPGFAASETLALPNSTASTSRVSGTIVMMMSASVAASAALAHRITSPSIMPDGTPDRLERATR